MPKYTKSNPIPNTRVKAIGINDQPSAIFLDTAAETELQVKTQLTIKTPSKIIFPITINLLSSAPAY
ncbi:MAG: hypothetical protein WC405_17610 [Syntrophales bacterium]